MSLHEAEMESRVDELYDKVEKLEAEVEALRKFAAEVIRYARGVHDDHLADLARDFLKEPTK
jgi:archaellum component FlaC